MRILGRLFDELITDIEIAVRQIPGREFRLQEHEGYRSRPVIEVSPSPGEAGSCFYLLGGPFGSFSEVSLTDGLGCEIKVQRRTSGWIIVEILDDEARRRNGEPKVYTALLNTGETVDFRDCHGRTVSVTRLRRSISRTILHELGINV